MFYNSSGEYNECVSHGACSIAPNISSMNEIVIYLLKQTAYYLFITYDLNLNNTKEILNDLLYFLAFMDCLKDFSESQIIDIFSAIYNNLIQIKINYKNYCKEKNLLYKGLKNYIQLPQKFKLSDILKLGEIQYLRRIKNLNFDKNYLIEILLCTIKNTSLNLINLKEYNEYNNNAEKLILESLSLLNFSNIKIDKLKGNITELAILSVDILEKINSIITEKYGILESSSVSLSTRPNKAIMVSGSNLNDLNNLLIALESYNIDIYTNGNLLLAHSYPYFKKFKNLKGNFGNDTFSNILDFATFPGAILLTKHESQNIEYLYRGRLFTTEKIQPKGVSKIENNNFTPIIESALQAKGFAKGKNKDNKTVGFNQNELDEILDNFISLNSENIFITGFVDNSINAYNYIKVFLSNLPENSSAISFSINIEKPNILYFEICNNYSILYLILKKLFSKISIKSDKIHFIFTKCDTKNLTNMIYLKNIGTKNLYIVQCSPNSINPAILKTFNNLYNIKTLTNPIADIKDITEIKKGTQ